MRHFSFGNQVAEAEVLLWVDLSLSAFERISDEADIAVAPGPSTDSSCILGMSLQRTAPGSWIGQRLNRSRNSAECL